MAARSSKTGEGNTTLRGGEMNVTMTTLNGSDRGRINAQLPAKMVSILYFFIFLLSKKFKKDQGNIFS